VLCTDFTFICVHDKIKGQVADVLSVYGSNCDVPFAVRLFLYKEVIFLKIRGLQKLTLLDFPGKTGCTVFLGGCNFRCPFCQNSELILPGAVSYEISQEEFFSFLKKRSGILDGVCVSGGEPLVSVGVEDFIARIKDMGYLVKLDTNGAFPDKLRAIAEKKLIDYVAMDIKNSPSGYADTVGLKDFDMAPIYESVDFLMNGSLDFEFRTTVVKQLHTAENFLEIAQWLKGDEKYFLQQFKDSQFVLQKGLCAYENDELLAMLDILRPYIPCVQVRGI